MSAGTKIQWADDTANFWRGCAKVSPGCAHCYAEKNIGVKMHGIQWGKGAARVKSKSASAECRSWNNRPMVCNSCGKTKNIYPPPECCGQESYHRRRVFSLSLGDWLDEEVPIEWLAEMLRTIYECPNLDFLLLTKRLENWRQRLQAILETEVDETNDPEWLVTHKGEPGWALAVAAWLGNYDLKVEPFPNVWLGVSVENQAMANLRVPQLLAIPARVRFLSCEPLLEGVQLGLNGINYERMLNGPAASERGIDWVIVGGESGPKARACHLAWIRSIVEQCARSGTACFVKQMGDHSILKEGNRYLWGSKKGGDPKEWPKDLRVRQFPEIQHCENGGTK